MSSSVRSYKEVALIAGVGGLVGAAITKYFCSSGSEFKGSATGVSSSAPKAGRKKYYIGVDIGGTTISVILLDKEGKQINDAMRHIEDQSETGVVRLVSSMVKGVLSEPGASVGLSDVAAIGVGSPGVNDLEKGVIMKAANFPQWTNFCITDVLSKELDNVPVYLENDANAALLAEVWIGAGKGCSDVVMMTLGTGVGGAIMSGGRLIHGATGMAGEIGHAIVERNGRLNEGTGVRGIFEAYASATAVAQHANALQDSHHAFDHLGWGKVTCKDVFELAEKRDCAWARQVLNTTIDYLGIGCINVCRYYDPKVILLSGGMTLAGPGLLEKVKKAFLKHHWSIFEPTCEIKFATTGNQAGAIGAAYSALLKCETS
jgi:glucokinase